MTSGNYGPLKLRNALNYNGVALKFVCINVLVYFFTSDDSFCLQSKFRDAIVSSHKGKTGESR